MKTQTTNPEKTMAKQTATELYQIRKANITSMLTRINDLLATHAAEQAASPRDWGFAGDLGKIESDLAEVVRFLANEEE
ncbi:MAG: hypothetical protein V1755_05505 [Chloroflexota bacterium]